VCVSLVKTLQTLGALEQPEISSLLKPKAADIVDGARITDLGRAMSVFPVSPRYGAIVTRIRISPTVRSSLTRNSFGKMLALGKQGECLPFVIAIVAALTVGDPLIHPRFMSSTDEQADEAESDEQKKALLKRRKEEEEIDEEARQLKEALSEFSGKKAVTPKRQAASVASAKQKRLNNEIQKGMSNATRLIGKHEKLT
jgi:ATP-dependent RNA helicase DHX37/DHR1